MTAGRSFIILNKEDGTFCEVGATGYCKIEIKTDKSKIRIYVQGLKKDVGSYDIYLLCQENDLIYVKLGELETHHDGANFECEVDTNNVNETGLNISKFNIVTVCKKSNNIFSFPLIGYHNITKNSTWINVFINKLKQNNNYVAEDTNNAIERNDEIVSTTEIKDSQEIKQVQDELIDYNKFKAIRRGTIHDVNKIMNSLQGVSEFNPFSKSKLRYKWWKIKDFKIIENIFEYSSASQHVFTHPLIKKILKDSEFFIFGVVSDQNDKVKYISYGFPTKYSNKDQFYIGGFSNFYPEDGNDRKNGESGYWIIHVRTDNDNIVITI